jgi:cell shape-determining protein MreD
MRNSLLFVPLLVGFVFAHLLLRVGLGVGDAAPDLLTVSLLLSARQVRSGQAAGLGFFLGLLEDGFSILAFGANTLTLVVLALLASRTRDLLVSETPGFLLAYLTIGVWVRGILHWIVTAVDLRTRAVPALLIEAPVVAIYSASTVVLLLVILRVVQWDPQR